MKRNIHDIERLANYIRSEYDLEDEYIYDEHEILRDFQFGHIDEEEFEQELRKLYKEYQNANEKLEREEAGILKKEENVYNYKMKKKTYRCDAGSVAVLCGESIIHFNNGYGDGNFKIYEFESEIDFEEYKKEHFEKYDIELKDYKFITGCEFKNARVLDYDCLHLENITEENILFELNGRYGIYYNYGKIYFVKYKRY